MKLPSLDWTRREGLIALVAALGAEECRFVGGCVRDGLLGIAAHDIDLATRIHPQEVLSRLSAAGIRAVPTGLEHGTITAVLPEGPVEVTTLRRDIATDGRRATIAFATEWRDDAARRDFTMNALYAHPETLEIDDYFGGLDDLAARRVRFIGDAEERTAEDHLRILRFFRFQARFGSEPADQDALSACARCAPMLKGLSRERVGWELQSLLAIPDPSPTLRQMHDLGVLQVVLPEAGAAELSALNALIAAEKAAQVPPDPVRRLTALLPRDRDAATLVASRLRLSNAQKKRIARGAERNEADAKDPRGLAYRLGRETAEDRLLLAGASLDALQGWEMPVLPVGGRDVVSGGIAKGPEVARVLQAVERRWIAEAFPGEARVREMLNEEIGRDG